MNEPWSCVSRLTLHPASLTAKYLSSRFILPQLICKFHARATQECKTSAREGERERRIIARWAINLLALSSRLPYQLGLRMLLLTQRATYFVKSEKRELRIDSYSWWSALDLQPAGCLGVRARLRASYNTTDRGWHSILLRACYCACYAFYV